MPFREKGGVTYVGRDAIRNLRETDPKTYVEIYSPLERLWYRLTLW